MTKTIMIVDDNPETLTLCSLIFKRKGYTVLTTEDGESALDMLQDAIPDLFILDVMMPEINGIDLCQRIRALQDHEHTPVIVLSAYSDTGVVGQAFAAGANDYVLKPVNPIALEGKVRDLLAE